MSDRRPRYLTERQTASKVYYLWQPSSELRAQGWKAVILKSAHGRHSSYSMAMLQSAWLNAMLDAWSQGRQEKMLRLQQQWADRIGSSNPQNLPSCDYVAYHWPRPRAHATRRERGRGFIYFLRLGETVKIGYWADPFRRALNIRTNAPGEIDRFIAVPGRRKDERRLHAALAGSNARGEWFYWSHEVKQMVAQVAAQGLDRK